MKPDEPKGRARLREHFRLMEPDELTPEGRWERVAELLAAGLGLVREARCLGERCGARMAALRSIGNFGTPPYSYPSGRVHRTLPYLLSSLRSGHPDGAGLSVPAPGGSRPAQRKICGARREGGLRKFCRTRTRT